MAEVWIANHNSPSQTVLAGTESGLKRGEEKLKAANIRSQRIPVACGFHSPLIAEAKEPLARALAEVRFASPRKPVFSNTTAAPHGSTPQQIVRQLADHLVSPVRFADEIEAMYAAGARVFVEVGPQAVLTGLAGQILAGSRTSLSRPTSSRDRDCVQLAHLLGQLLAAGVPANLDRLYQGRGVQPFDLAKLGPDTGKPMHSPTAWVVNGVRSRPVNGPEPRLLGQALPERVTGMGQSDIRRIQESRSLESPSTRKAAGTTSLTVPIGACCCHARRFLHPRTTMNNTETPTPPSPDHNRDFTACCKVAPDVSSSHDALPGRDGPVPRHAAERDARVPRVGWGRPRPINERELLATSQRSGPTRIASASTSESPDRVGREHRIAAAVRSQTASRLLRPHRPRQLVNRRAMASRLRATASRTEDGSTATHSSPVCSISSAIGPGTRRKP